MKNRLIYLLLVISGTSFGQVSINQLYSKEEPALFSSSAYSSIITRQNSCSFFLSDFLFNVTKEGKFLIDLQINLNSYSISTTTPDKVRSIRMLFKDVIEIKEKDKPIRLSLSNTKLADNIILTDVTDIDIFVRLIPTNDDQQSAFKVISPILNTIIPNSSTVTNVIDNFISSARKGEKKDELLFNANIAVPLNIFEFKKLEADEKVNLIRNNSVLGIILGGSQEAAFSNSLVGDAATLVNSVAKFVSGKQVFKKENVKYEGLINIYFTKDINPLLPSSISTALYELNNLPVIDINNAYEAFKVKMKEISSAAKNARVDQKINFQTEYSINVYLRLGEIYMDYLKKSSDGAPSTTDNWVSKFRTFDLDINNGGAANSFQAIGINDIYNERLAKIYIPYSLPDDLTISFYSWQIALHNFLAEKGYLNLAKPKTSVTQKNKS